MSKIKVDLLIRDELLYEMKVRNLNYDDKSIVADLRKSLRKGLLDKIEPNYKNLVNKITLPSEIESLNSKIEFCLENVSTLTKDSRPIDVARLGTKIEHCKNRLNNLLKFKMTDEEKSECEKLIKSIKLVTDSLDTLSYDTEIVEQSVRKLSESNIEQEMFENVFDQTPAKMATDSVNLNQTIDPVVLSQTLSTGQVGQPFDLNLYQKLPNPIVQYLDRVTISNGLGINDLLEFLRMIFKVKRETSLIDYQIIELFIPKTLSPLQNILLSCKNSTIEYLQTEILKAFVPFNLRENLVRDLVNRPQNVGEPLSMYIESIKEYSTILNCKYSESDLVQMLKIGINPTERANLVFASKIETFHDLEQACVHSQNVAYSNYLRSRLPPMFVNNNQKPNEKKCFNCGRSGHLAKNCYRKQNPKNL